MVEGRFKGASPRVGIPFGGLYENEYSMLGLY